MLLSILARLLLNVVRLFLLPLTLLGRVLARPRARWVHVRLRPRLVEIDRPVPRWLEYFPSMLARRPTSLTLLRELVDMIVEDDRIEGVVVDVPPLSAGWATCESLRQLLIRLRERDRRVVVFLSQGGGNRELYVASAADRVVVTPRGQLTPLGLAASVLYFKPLLERVGLELEVHRRAEYKTAVEPATRSEMSPEQREQTEALLDTIDGALRRALLERPGVDEAAVEAFFERAMLSPSDAVELGLVDGVGYEDELPTWLTEDRAITRVVRAPRYYRYKKRRLFARVMPQRFVAVIPVHGTIAEGRPDTAGGRRLTNTVTSIRVARQNPLVAGVVLHVDSPGGSVLSSDLIHREIVRLKERKPVVASFGDVAASGGYYVAASADAVVAQRMTITGSIGVVSARLITQGVLDKVGVRQDTIRKAPHADMMARAGRLDEAESAILDREIDTFYRAFVALVAEGRDRPVDEIEPLARGRVWSGADARKRGLVDAHGGLDRALDEVRDRLRDRLPSAQVARLEPKLLRPRLIELPPPEPRKVGEEAVASTLGFVDPSMRDVFELARGRDRVLCYAVDLPRIV